MYANAVSGDGGLEKGRVEYMKESDTRLPIEKDELVFVKGSNKATTKDGEEVETTDRAFLMPIWLCKVLEAVPHNVPDDHLIPIR